MCGRILKKKQSIAEQLQKKQKKIWLLFEDFKIYDIFYKIQNFFGT